MKKNIVKLILILLAVIIILVLAFLAFIQADSEDLGLLDDNDQSTILVFSGDGCPYCVDVENYIIANNIKDKLDLKVKEVYNNLDNAQLFEEKFNQCLPPVLTFGVPFLWHNQTCLVGPYEIIDYLEQRLD